MEQKVQQPTTSNEDKLKEENANLKKYIKKLEKENASYKRFLGGK